MDCPNPNDALEPDRLVGTFPRAMEAREAALVAAALGFPHLIRRMGNDYQLWVPSVAAGAVTEGIAALQSEAMAEPAELITEPEHSHKPAMGGLAAVPFLVAVTVLIFASAWGHQARLGPEALAEGAARADEIAAGAWWLNFTALTLHGDLEHLAGNWFLATVLFVVASPRLGMGVAVLLAVYGGALGNWFNSIAAAGTQHSSIGASTAVFALLGAIAGSEAVTQLQRSARTHWLRRVAIPTIGSLAMLALYGGGDPAGPDRTDVGAHLFGWLAGMICGFAAGWLPERILRQPLLQGACSGSALLAVYVAWRAAMLHSS